MPVYRIYAEKRTEYATPAQQLLADIQSSLQIPVTALRMIHRYDVETEKKYDFEKAVSVVFSEPQVDTTYRALPELERGQFLIAVEALPGQFDQRADSAAQCMQILCGGERPTIRTATIYLFTGNVPEEQQEALRRYLINPVESRDASLELPETLEMEEEAPAAVEICTGFCTLDDGKLENFRRELGLAMDFDDIRFCQNYFRNTEHRDPTITEIRMIDTYWSDHCRHTTFLTRLTDVKIEPEYVKETYESYLSGREATGRGDRPITLMDVATAATRKIRADGKLHDVDESDEINACSVKVKVDENGRDRDWILMFKNETHNHPTEIEPYGGAATCLGGAIRDPLAGRTYVYQAMRVTGAANPLVPVEDTPVGKLPQRKITVGAANGYSAYGNQIGLATGHVSEIYHPGYLAKRLEIGAVLGAAPAGNIHRESPVPGDVIILLGGKTGRDGCGGATGSSKSLDVQSIDTCGAEVQKGNPPEERKIQRLFRDPAVTKMIKRCNDFGAGGISVAIGELADGLEIRLDEVPKKYAGLDGTELAISESQERMAVVVAAENAAMFIRLAGRENLEATAVATVTETPRLKMTWKGKTILDLSRVFLNSNGASKEAKAVVALPESEPALYPENSLAAWEEMCENLNICSQKGLVERFDSTIGAGTVLMPYGGKYQRTESQAMAAKFPVEHGETQTCSLMGWGYHPTIAAENPYRGGLDAVITSIAKVVAAGGSAKRCWLTFQEYFERMNENPKRWGVPLATLLGAYRAQVELECASIGGKDSMSGTFEQIDVPPTLVSFAVSTCRLDDIISTEFKAAGDDVIFLKPELDADGMPVFESVRNLFARVEKMIAEKYVKAAWVIDFGGIAEGVMKMGFGNRIGFSFTRALTSEELFAPCCGGFLLELEGAAQNVSEKIGETIAEPRIHCKTNDSKTDFSLDLDALHTRWQKRLEPIFPCRAEHTSFEETLVSAQPEKTVETLTAGAGHLLRHTSGATVARPRVLIPVFPGTNCEYDTARAFENAGARVQTFVIRNQNAEQLQEDIVTFSALLRNSQILMIAGGFSGGDEPEGSAKFITSFFQNARLKEAVADLLENRDGLALGICNGFQALIKLGLVPFGKIVEATDVSPTLTFNTIARHQSMLVRTRVASNRSPWLAGLEIGDITNTAISHGEGRLVAPEKLLEDMAENGQIATQYVDLDGKATMEMPWNPNGSMWAVEGLTSPDGRVFGKMGHSERVGRGLYQNVPGETDQKLFASGVAYFA